MRFLALAGSVFERCDDSSGTVSAIFHSAASDLGGIATDAKPDPKTLAEDAFRALTQNDLRPIRSADRCSVASPGTGRFGALEAADDHSVEEPVPKPDDHERREIGYGSDGPVYADERAEQFRSSTVRLALMAIADAEGDVDAYISQYDEHTRKRPRIAAEIARRLLAAGRAEDAWRTIEATEHRRSGWDWPDFEWEDVRIDVLDALDRTDEAQEARRSCFERSLSAEHLRAYLRRLPGFEDMDAEERALDHAQNFGSPLQALSFLASWPALDRAAALVIRRATDLDGDHYEILAPAADALAGKYPLAATLALRAMIDSTLTHARSSRYKPRRPAPQGVFAPGFGDRAIRGFRDARRLRGKTAPGAREKAFVLGSDPLGGPTGARTDTLVFRWLREPCSHLTAALFSNKTEPPPWPSGVNLQLKCPQL